MARESVAAERREAERRRQAEEAEKARRARLKALRQRGEAAWREIEAEIERRNASGYDRAASLLSDLQALALEEGSQADFSHRLARIRALRRDRAQCSPSALELVDPGDNHQDFRGDRQRAGIQETRVHTQKYTRLHPFSKRQCRHPIMPE